MCARVDEFIFFNNTAVFLFQNYARYQVRNVKFFQREADKVFYGIAVGNLSLRAGACA
jgi:hypothetical protein